MTRTIEPVVQRRTINPAIVQVAAITAILLGLLGRAAAQNASMPPLNGVGSTPRERFVVDLNQTRALLDACVKAAASVGPENCAVADPSGFLVGFVHMDNAFLGSIEASQQKARTAVLFGGLNSRMVGQMAQPGQPLQEIEESNGGLSAIGGGYPIYYKNHLIGGFGVSGVTVPKDEMVALQALKDAGFQTNA